MTHINGNRCPATCSRLVTTTMAAGFSFGSYELAVVAVPGVLAFSLYRFIRFRNAYAHLPLPPGPKASWLGRVSLPQKYQWKTYAKWKDIYGMPL